MSHDITATPEATLTIKQMAAQSGMSEYTLRYYEKIGLIQPIPRDGMGYSLRVNVKKHEASTTHPDREPQFEVIASQRQVFQAAGWAIISVDTKKKELIGNAQKRRASLGSRSRGRQCA